MATITRALVISKLDYYNIVCKGLSYRKVLKLQLIHNSQHCLLKLVKEFHSLLEMKAHHHTRIDTAAIKELLGPI